MEVSLKGIWTKAEKWLKAAGLAAIGIVAAYFGVVPSLNGARDVAELRATRTSWAPQALWRQDRLSTFVSREPATVSGLIGGVPGGIAQRSISPTEQSDAAESALPAPPPPAAMPDSPDRKMVRTDSLYLVVKHPAEAAEQVRQLASRLGGFLVTSEVSGDADAASASVTIRVPAPRFEEARAAIRKLGLRVESERVEAQDVTRQYVDQEAHLRNLRAEEQQYLTILKHAATVKDTLEVSEKLSDVRGEVEQQQADFEALSKQVETVAITVSLQAEADTQVFGLQWQPLYRLKVAARNGLDSLGDYIGTMTAFALYLPSILLWLATILAGAAVGWRILRWSARVIFAPPRAPGTPAV
jgi:Domain of unknown function (DUF4349)